MKMFTLRAMLMAILVLAFTTNCGTPSSMLSTGSTLITSMTKNPTLTKFAGLLRTPGLGKFLDETLKGKFTMLAPTNDALASMGNDMMTKISNPANVADLANMLKNYIIPSKVDASQLKQGGIKTANGTEVKLPSDVTLGSTISDKQFNIIPINKLLN